MSDDQRLPLMSIRAVEGTRKVMSVERPRWASADVDLDRPSVARVYDYYLGGSHNFAVDREFAEKVRQALPGVTQIARENRAFLRRAVRDLCNDGIDQFVDLGSGIPTEGNVHEVVQEINPDARVVYVDWDPVAVAHGQSILTDNDRAVAIHGDLREPEIVFADPRLRQLIDPSKPTAVLLIAVLHFVPDERRPIELVRRIAGFLAPHSYIAISHIGSSPARQRQAQGKAAALYTQTASPVITRTQEEITALFGGFPIVEPGVVQMSRWRPDPSEDLDSIVDDLPGYAGIARIG